MGRFERPFLQLHTVSCVFRGFVPFWPLSAVPGFYVVIL